MIMEVCLLEARVNVLVRIPRGKRLTQFRRTQREFIMRTNIMVYVEYGELQGTGQDPDLTAAEMSPEGTRGGKVTRA